DDERVQRVERRDLHRIHCSLLPTGDPRGARKPAPGGGARCSLRRLTNLAALSVLTVNASKRRYEMCAVPEARPLLSLFAQRAAPSRPLSTWLTPLRIGRRRASQ